jgi:TRAP-type C4-dicarboxylate transport system permease small subunit
MEVGREVDMTTKYDATPDEEIAHPSSATSGWQRVVKQLLGIFGAIGIFLGLFILFAGDGQYLGFWDSTWRVGDISEWWGYGLLAAGGVLWVAALGWILAGRTRRI